MIATFYNSWLILPTEPSKMQANEEEEEEEEKYSAENNEVSVVSISFAIYLISI